MKKLWVLPLALTVLTACEEDDTSWIAQLEDMRKELALQDSAHNAEREFLQNEISRKEQEQLLENERLREELKKLEDAQRYGQELLTDNPLEKIYTQPGFASIFKTWGFIGDSYSSGVFEYEGTNGNQTSSEFYDYSWGQCICRMTGSSGSNYGQGGMWTTAWINGTEKERTWALAKKDPKQAYIIALGYNDLYTWGHTPKGDLATDVHLDDYELNPQTYAGNMAGIIQRLRSINPNCYIFLVTLPNEPSLTASYPTDEYNDIVRGLPSFFKNTYVIDLYKHAPVYDEEFKNKYFLGMHMSAVGYQQTAYMFVTYIDWIVRKYPSDFSDVFKQGDWNKH